MKNLKRGNRLGRWLAHQKMEALCTLVELLARLLGRKKWKKSWDRFIRISQAYRSSLPLESQDRPLTQEENDNLWQQSACESIRGSIYSLTEKAYQKKKSWYCDSSSSSFDSGGIERKYLQWRIRYLISMSSLML
ncbi:hypothetical protein H5410_015570 [Solanum commersonii]|uniref:Uncharacterized protein n=1 Tax=Solanum commersonii TaxID=4109 RepID=A0A9J5ZUT5_SOLCO|nr:hypothetical protein H5410_015570 [Solanum commersonii]